MKPVRRMCTHLRMKPSVAKAVSKQMIAGEYCMSQGTMHSLKMTVNIAVMEFIGVTSQYQQLQITGMKIFWIDS